jgi:hypothetical protein
MEFPPATAVWKRMAKEEQGIPVFVMAYAVIVAMLVLGSLLG